MSISVLDGILNKMFKAHHNGATQEQWAQRVSLEGLAVEIFKLVSRGATPEQWAEWLRAPLEHAAAQGNHGLVDKLLGAGADGSAGWKGCGGRTLLQAAAVGGSEGVVSSLLVAGAQPDVNVLSSAMHTLSPLYQATSSGHEAAARLLIHAGADVNFVLPKNKRTVLHAAILGRYERLAKELMIGGADVEATDPSDGTTPLHMAAKNGLEEVVSALLLRGVDKDAVDNDGDSALMLASGAFEKEAHPAVVETLLAAGADVNIRRPTKLRCSALDWASSRGNVPFIEALVRRGAHVNSCDDIHGLSALHKAAFYDKADSVGALVEAGADVETKTKRGRTPLCIAAEKGCPKALLALLQKGAVLSAQGIGGKTPLHLACFFQSKGVETVVDMLLRWGADETALDNDGNSPGDLLDVVRWGRACSQHDIERVRLLLTRAPTERAWRRRGWLAMLRSRASRANASGGSEGAEASNDAGGGGVGESRKVARIEGALGVAVGEGAQAGSGVGEVGNEAFSGAVARLVGLKPEGVFRMVLEFL